jgi:hypothetical protein
MNIYKVSYIVVNIQHPGIIVNTKQKPVIGDIVRIGRQKFEVVEVNEISPPEENFCHLLAKCKYIEESTL